MSRARRAEDRLPKQRNPRGRIARGLASMGLKPKNQIYVPPPAEACDRQVFYVYPTGSDNDGHMLVVRIWVYRGLIVDFSINQVIEDGGSWVDVARIDCCGGVIHRHQFDSQGQDLIGHEPIMTIPADGGWEVVDKGYNEAYSIMHDEFDDNLRRWRGDRA